MHRSKKFNQSKRTLVGFEPGPRHAFARGTRLVLADPAAMSGTASLVSALLRCATIAFRDGYLPAAIRGNPSE
jgi:hypothetical protein